MPMPGREGTWGYGASAGDNPRRSLEGEEGDEGGAWAWGSVWCYDPWNGVGR